MASDGTGREAELRGVVADPAAVAVELAQFRTAASALDDAIGRLDETYTGQWVALAGGTIHASGELESLLCELESLGIRREHAAVRYVQPAAAILIL